MLEMSIFAALLMLISAPVQSETFKLGLLHGDAEVYAYEISVLKLAIKAAPGSHKLQIIPMLKTSQERILRFLQSPEEKINVFFTADSPARDASLLRVNIPLTRGLLGHRVLVVRRANLSKYMSANSLPELRKITIGSGLGWPDNPIFRAAGFMVIEAPYRNLWKMLAINRFDAFQRGIQEFSIKLEQRQNLELTTIPDIMIVFPFDYYFFVSQKNQHLHDLLREGLENAYADGSFMENFNTHPAIRKAIEQGNLLTRKAIYIENPLMSDDIRNIPDKYWHKPKK